MGRDLDAMSYEEAVRALRELVARGDPNRARKVTPVIQIDRGLGSEFRTLQPVEARSLSEADALAQAAAARYVRETPGYENAEVKQINLRLMKE